MFRILVRQLDGKWVTSPKDLCVPDGVANSEKEAIEKLKANYKKKITACISATPPQALPITEISNILTPGARILRILIDAPPPRDADAPPLDLKNPLPV